MIRHLCHLAFCLMAATTWCAAAEPGASPSQETSAIVATVAGEPVTADEVRLAMDRRKAEVFSWFRGHHGMEDHTGYWMDRSDVSPSPISRLREMVLADLKEMKALMREAKARGLVTDISHAAFLRELEQENTRRKELVASGGVIYGPRQYSVPAYHSIRYRDTVHRLKQVLQAEAAHTLTDQDVETYRRAHPDDFNHGTPEQNREATLKHLRDVHAEQALRAIVGKTEIRWIDKTTFESIRPRTDPPG